MALTIIKPTKSAKHLPKQLLESSCIRSLQKDCRTLDAPFSPTHFACWVVSPGLQILRRPNPQSLSDKLFQFHRFKNIFFKLIVHLKQRSHNFGLQETKHNENLLTNCSFAKFTVLNKCKHGLGQERKRTNLKLNLVSTLTY